MRKIAFYLIALMQQEIMFNLMYYFGLKGRETQPKLRKDSIICRTSSIGKRYLEMKHELLIKNSRASLTRRNMKMRKKRRLMKTTYVKMSVP